MKTTKTLRFALPLIAVLTTGRAALAEPTAAEKATAESLYDEARALLRAGKTETACAKFAESQRLDPGTGTLLYLGECYERGGKLASAWASFREAYASAHAANQEDRAKIAQARAAALEPKLPRLTIKVATPTPGLEIKHDNAAVGEALLGSATPVDPGTHTITATASGYKPWTKSVDLAASDATTIEVPALEKEAVPVEAPPPPPPPVAVTPPPPPPPAPPPPSSMSGRRIAALVVGGIGVVGIGIGSVTGLKAFSGWSDTEKNCPHDLCTPVGRQDASSARSDATVSTITMIAGAACLAGGAVLWFTAPSRAENGEKTAKTAEFAPFVGLGSAGVAGRF